MLKTFGAGRLAKDPKIVTVGNSQKAYFTIVCNEIRENNTGEKIINPHFTDCELWDTAASIFIDNYQKGDIVYIEGINKQERWTKDGENKLKNIVRVTKFYKVQELPKEDN